MAQNGYNYPSPQNTLQPTDLSSSNNLGNSGVGPAYNAQATPSPAYGGASQGVSSAGIFGAKPNAAPSSPSFGGAATALPSSSAFGNKPNAIPPSSSFGNQAAYGKQPNAPSTFGSGQSFGGQSPYGSQSGAQIPFAGQSGVFGGSQASSGGFNRPSSLGGNVNAGGGNVLSASAAFDRNGDNRGVSSSFDRNDINSGNSASQGGGNDDGSYAGGDYSAIPGTAGVDYTIYSEIPKTSFDCKQQQFPGYYADVEAQCQVFHICALNTTFDFLCPNGTIFSQEHLVCVWWNQFDCNSAPSLYGNNAYIYDYSKTGGSPSAQNDLGSGSQGFDTQGLNYPTAPGQVSQSRPVAPSNPTNTFTSSSRGGGGGGIGAGIGGIGGIVGGIGGIGVPTGPIPSINNNYAGATQVTPRPFVDFNTVQPNLSGLNNLGGSGYQPPFVSPQQANIGPNPYGINQSPTESNLPFQINQSPSGPNAFATSPIPQSGGGSLPQSLDKPNRDSSTGILQSPPSSQYLPVRKS